MGKLRQNWLRPKLEAQPYVLGTFLEIASPQVVELLGLAGFDFVVIDCEHGAIGLDRVEELVRAAATTDICPLVRVPQCDPVAIRLPLDMGAVGIHVPQVESLDMAKTAARSARFFPRGERGMQPYVRAASFRHYDTAAYLAEANEQVVNVVHIEGRGGVEALDEILNLDGIDVAFLGPYDLSQALGIPGQVNDPKVEQTIQNVVKQAAGRKIIGTYCDDVAGARKRIAAGVHYITLALDAKFLLSKASEVVAEVKY